jgi:predicted alpha/beta hydrolase
MPEHAFALHTVDGTPLAATAYDPPGVPRAALVIGGAMGVPQDYYAPFAHWLADQQGIAVLSFDYRGMGRSRRGPLAEERADVLTWARQDCAAALQAAEARWPGVATYWLGHSLGAQIIGLVPGHERLAGMLSVAAGSGYWRLNAPRVRLLVWWLWWVVAPLALRVCGYFPGRRLRKIGDLPGGVMAQWRRWCLHPDYVGGESEAVRAELAAVTLPLTVLSMTDDELMTWEGTRSLFGLYRSAPVEYRRLAPAEHGLRQIGHFGFFRAKMRDVLWPIVPRWIEQTP